MKRILFLIPFILSDYSFSFSSPEQSFYCKFKQERFVKTVNLKLVSTGDVLVENGGKIIWSTRDPVENIILVEANRIYRLQNDKKLPLKNPIIKKMTEVMSSALKGDKTSLQKYFILENKNDGHTNLLVPKDEKLKKIIQLIEIKTKKYIESFYMLEASGGYIKLAFDHCSKKI